MSGMPGIGSKAPGIWWARGPAVDGEESSVEQREGNELRRGC